MGNLMTSMWTGVSGLKVNQTALNTTSHNLSNIETKGYVRQQVLLTDNIYTNLGMNHISTNQIGLGTSMQEIRQVRDVFIDKSYRLEVGRQEFYQIQSDAATEIETILGEFGDSTFAASIDDLWSALTDLSEEPDSIVKRSILASTASTFISYAELLKEQLCEYQGKVNDKIQTQVDRINAIGDEIKALNTEIVYQEASGQNANDYRDRRNVLLDELSGYVNITYSEDWDGRVSINIEGTQFVTQDNVFYLKTEELVSEDEQEFADRMNEMIKGGGLFQVSALLEAIKTEITNNTTSGANNVIAAVKDSEAYKTWSKYGDVTITYDNNNYVVKFGGKEIIKTSDGVNNNGSDKSEQNLLAVIKTAIENKKSDSEAALKEIRNSAIWKTMSQYGSLEIKYDGTNYIVTFNDIQLIKTKDGEPDKKDTTNVIDYQPKSTGFQNVVWENTGTDVFRLTGEYASYNNTDVGSLKSILIARGNTSANYTDIPQKADYYTKDGSFDQTAYNAAVAKFNENIDSCLLTSTQAQIDTLVHYVVTTINDALCPNVGLTVKSMQKYVDLNGTEGTVDNTTKIKINGSDYTLAEAEAAGFQVLDLANTSVGMDEDSTIGETLFNRKNMDRYTKATLNVKDKDGNYIIDKDNKPMTVTVYVYNQEYDSNIYSQYTIGQIEVNQDILDDVSKLPLSYSKYSDRYGGYNFDVCKKILDLWGTDSVQISPNVYTKYNFTDYYDAVAGNVGTVGGLYGEKLDMLEETTAYIGNSRESILGVASEEELTNLITFQHAYNASSRYINAINELLETVINIGR